MVLLWQSYGASPAILDHTVLPATRHKWTRPALTPARRRVLDLPTPEGWKAELIGYAAMQRPVVELVTSRSQVRRPNHYTTEPPRDYRGSGKVVHNVVKCRTGEDWKDSWQDIDGQQYTVTCVHCVTT